MNPCFGITNLGSGSGGNATVIHGPAGNLLLDAGFTAKELSVRMEKAGIDPAGIAAVLITHDHSDHTRGCRVFTEKFGIPAYVTNKTCISMTRRKELGPKVVLFSPGTPFELCGVRIEPFSVPHDAPDTVAFVFRCGTSKIAVATDLGTINTLAMTRLEDCNILLLESNHDPQMLAASPRPLQLKRRIMGSFGHLSNEDAMESLGTLVSARTHYLLLGHISSECNDRELVRRLTVHRLEELHRTDITFYMASQNAATPTLWADAFPALTKKAQ